MKSPEAYLEQRQKALAYLQARLVAAQEKGLSAAKQRFYTQAAKLEAMSPLKVLLRGYAMVQDESGQVVRSVSQVKENDRISISVSDGTIQAVVTAAQEGTTYESGKHDL